MTLELKFLIVLALCLAAVIGYMVYSFRTAKEVDDTPPIRYCFYMRINKYTYSEAKEFWENERNNRGCKRTMVDIYNNIDNTFTERVLCSEYFTK